MALSEMCMIVGGYSVSHWLPVDKLGPINAVCTAIALFLIYLLVLEGKVSHQWVTSLTLPHQNLISYPSTSHSNDSPAKTILARAYEKKCCNPFRYNQPERGTFIIRYGINLNWKKPNIHEAKRFCAFFEHCE